MKQIHLEGSWTIKAPREEVYRIITDFEKMPGYFPSVAKSLVVTDRDGDKMTLLATTKAFIGSKDFHVQMETELRPPEGFISKNTSSLGIEQEQFLMDEIPEGTRIRYINDVEIKSLFFRLVGRLFMTGATVTASLRSIGRLFIGTFALKYWERAVIKKLKQLLEKE
ncbi:SRPBCC family protein [Chloroflexota bacterium]